MTQTAVFDAQAILNTKVPQLTPPTFTANIWASQWESATAYRRITLILAMNQASATNGVVIEQSGAASPSADADAWWWTADSTKNVTHPVNAAVAYHQSAMSVERVGTHVRLVVKHGGVAPTTFYAKLIGAGVT